MNAWLPHPWSELVVVLLVEIAVIFAAGKIAALRTQSGQWQRTIWQVVTVSILLVTLGELNGIRSLVFSWRHGASGSADFALVTSTKSSRRVFSATTSPRLRIERSGDEMISAEAATRERTEAEPVVAEASSPALSTEQTSWRLPSAAAFWICGLALLSARILAHLIVTTAVRFKAKPCCDELILNAIKRLATVLGIRRRISTRQISRARAPFTFGVARPVVVLPEKFSSVLSRSQQETALAHELAHVASFDAAWRLLSACTCALLWWHPAVWLARRELYHATESAADEASMLVENGPARLAECLVVCAKLENRQAEAVIGIRGLNSGLAKRVARLMEMNAQPGRDEFQMGRFWGWRIAGSAAICAALWVAAALALPGDDVQWRTTAAGTIWNTASESVSRAQIRARTREAMQLYWKKDLESARSAFHEVLASDPTNTLALLYLARINARQASHMTTAVAQTNDRRGAVVHPPQAQDQEPIRARALAKASEPRAQAFSNKVSTPVVTVPAATTNSAKAESPYGEGVDVEALHALLNKKSGWGDYGLYDGGPVADRFATGPFRSLPKYGGSASKQQDASAPVTSGRNHLEAAAVSSAADEAIPQTREGMLRLLRTTVILTCGPFDGESVSNALIGLHAAARTAPGGSRINFLVADERIARRTITLSEPFTKMTVEECLNVLVTVLGGVTYDVEDYGVVLKPRATQPPLHTRFFRIKNYKARSWRPEGGVTNLATAQQDSLAAFLTGFKQIAKSAGADLNTEGTAVFFSDSIRSLMVRATLQDLDIVESLIQRLDGELPALRLEVRAIEVPVDVSPDGAATWPRASSNHWVQASGRDAFTNSGMPTVVGVLSPEEAVKMVSSLAAAGGENLLKMDHEPVAWVRCQTEHRAQVKVVDIRYIVTSLDHVAAATNGGLPEPIAEPFEIGPIVDIIPALLTDGYSVNLSVSGRMREFLGYREPATKSNTPEPLPQFRVRQAAGDVTVVSGNTLLLGAGTALKAIPAQKRNWYGAKIKSTNYIHTALFFLITPRVLDEDGSPMPEPANLDRIREASRYWAPDSRVSRGKFSVLGNLTSQIAEIAVELFPLTATQLKVLRQAANYTGNEGRPRLHVTNVTGGAGGSYHAEAKAILEILQARFKAAGADLGQLGRSISYHRTPDGGDISVCASREEIAIVREILKEL